MKQNVTVNLERAVVLKAKILAARRGTSISALLGEQIEALVGGDDAYQRARDRARELMAEGLPLGDVRESRDFFHER